jgi:PAS domain S-box-containing protein
MSGKDKLCTFFNQRWLDFTGRTMEQELGEGWTAGVHPEDLDRCLGLYSAAFDARVDFAMEYRLRRNDGEYRWIDDRGVPRFDSDGTFCGYIGSCSDITERKTFESSMRALTGRLISAQEEERARIARDLHDDFSQRLALLGIELGQLSMNLPASALGARDKIHKMLHNMREMATDLHTLSHHLHSSKLEHVGLVSALKALCSEMGEKHQIEIHFSGPQSSSKLPKDVALCLFRVAQEALGNVIKHSGTKGAEVELSENEHGIRLHIQDSGRGFDINDQNPDAGIGLIGMSERLRLVGGRFMVRSEPRKGTEIFAEVPLSLPADEMKSRTQIAGSTN